MFIRLAKAKLFLWKWARCTWMQFDVFVQPWVGLLLEIHLLKPRGCIVFAPG